MDDLLFYAILIALLAYFFVYLPQQKKLELQPTTEQAELELIIDTLLQEIQILNQSLQ